MLEYVESVLQFIHRRVRRCGKGGCFAHVATRWGSGVRAMSPLRELCRVLYVGSDSFRTVVLIFWRREWLDVVATVN